MANKKRQFTSIWVNQTRLADRFKLSAVALGRKLKELDLKGSNNAPTQRALDEEYAKFTPLSDGTPFCMWNKDKVSALLRQLDLQPTSRAEQHARTFARDLLALERQAQQRPGVDKEMRLPWDVVPPRLVALVERFLAEMR